MQRGVRQHEAELPVARRHRVGDQARRGPPGQQHDRPPRAGEQGFGQLVHLAQLAGRGRVRHHHRERLVLAVLGRAQPGRGGLAARVDRQVVPAQPLDRQHLPVLHDARRRGQHIISLPNASAGLAG